MKCVVGFGLQIPELKILIGHLVAEIPNVKVQENNKSGNPFLLWGTSHAGRTTSTQSVLLSCCLDVRSHQQHGTQRLIFIKIGMCIVVDTSVTHVVCYITKYNALCPLF